MKLEFEVIKPNLYVVNNEQRKDIFFAIRNSRKGKSGINAYKFLSSIDEIIEKYIGTLKIRNDDFEFLEKG